MRINLRIGLVSVVLLALGACSELKDFKAPAATKAEIHYIRDVISAVRCELYLGYKYAKSLDSVLVRKRAKQDVATKLEFTVVETRKPGLDASWKVPVGPNSLSLSLAGSRTQIATSTREINLKDKTHKLPICDESSPQAKLGLGLYNWIVSLVYILNNDLHDDLGSISYSVEFTLDVAPNGKLIFTRVISSAHGGSLTPSGSGGRKVTHKLTVTVAKPTGNPSTDAPAVNEAVANRTSK